MLSLRGFSFAPKIDDSSSTWRRSTRKSTHISRASVAIAGFHSRAQGPSLSKGWILEPKNEKGGGNCAVEVLLSSLEEVENETRQELRNETAQDQAEGEMVLVPGAKYVRGADLRKASFVRVYYVPALRVPAKESSTLARNLEEHLLNWQRVNNIARVPGDDIADDLESLFLRANEAGESSRRGIKSVILGKDGTAKTESCEEEEFRVNGTYDNRKQKAVKYQPYTVEVVEEQMEVDRVPSTQELLKKKWAGPTRLLLLKEEFYSGGVCRLPAPLQALLQSQSTCQLVSCRLTLFYEYWSAEEVLRDLLPQDVMVPGPFERFGHVAFLNLSHKQLKFRHLIAQVTLDKHQPVVRSVVLKQESRYTKSYSVGVEVLAGTSSLITTVTENGWQFRIDFGSVLWDSRLKEDRKRLVDLFSRSDIICDVFAGPGAVAIPAGSKARRIFANEVNPIGYRYLAHNVATNKLTSRVEVFNLDTHQFLSNVFDSERPLPITRVIITYPAALQDILDFFIGAFSRSSWELPSLPEVHIYRFSNAADPREHLAQEIENVLGERPQGMDIVRVAEVVPGEWMLRASFTIPEQVGFR
ncbi:hypothetical protein R1sor_010958 [Riccia sorocarpa]|uniref:tRNA (guanine(37)-N1)-methyltransferase n=1 Tax=Riccia sorocarpa TaxID=122646 RepID=A0ABD3I387_9MARC